MKTNSFLDNIHVKYQRMRSLFLSLSSSPSPSSFFLRIDMKVYEKP